MPGQVTDELPRPLSERERAALDFLLAVEAPGVDELRAQAVTARVVGRCTCGCATIDIAVDRRRGHASELMRSPAIEARTELSEDLDEFFELLLFVDGGWLSSLEIVYYGDQPPRELPPPGSFLPPYVPTRD
jgi:hypothetical protein